MIDYFFCILYKTFFNMDFNFIHLLILFFFIISNFLVFNCKNPVHSVLFLILSFVLSSLILFLFKIDFLALLYIIIYVGAIAVLFLFVVMMLNIKSVSINYQLMVIISFVSIFALINILIFLDKIFSNQNKDLLNQNLNFDSLSNIDVFGQILYNYNISLVLIAGLLLLIALIGSISLTLKKN